MKKSFCILALTAALGGCATGSISYQPPDGVKSLPTEKIVNKPYDKVWAEAVPALGKEFFVINNLDKESGLINLSYSGDPEKYVNCGWMSSSVKNARGSRLYSFPSASAYQTYEALQGNMLFVVTRQVKLEGRTNLIFEAIGKSQTKVTANTKYVVTKTGRFAPVAGGFPQNISDSISFNSNSGAAFSGQSGGHQCVANGKLEQEILSLID